MLNGIADRREMCSLTGIADRDKVNFYSYQDNQGFQISGKYMLIHVTGKPNLLCPSNVACRFHDILETDMSAKALQKVCLIQQ